MIVLNDAVLRLSHPERAWPDRHNPRHWAPSTQFKQIARELVDQVAPRQPVAICRHKAADAVLISPDDYLEFIAQCRERLDTLAARYDALVERSQSPQSRAGVDALFDAGGEELGRAALAAVDGS